MTIGVCWLLPKFCIVFFFIWRLWPRS